MSDEHDEHHDHHPSPWGPHDWAHGAPHNSWAPLVMSIGVGIFLFSFAATFTMNEARNDFIYNGSALPMIVVGLAISLSGLIIWWRQDYSFDGTYEPKATGLAAAIKDHCDVDATLIAGAGGIFDGRGVAACGGGASPTLPPRFDGSDGRELEQG